MSIDRRSVYYSCRPTVSQRATFRPANLPNLPPCPLRVLCVSVLNVPCRAPDPSLASVPVSDDSRVWYNTTNRRLTGIAQAVTNLQEETHMPLGATQTDCLNRWNVWRLSKARLTINDSINLRRHRNACEFYREKWNLEDALYQCFCLKDTPPETEEEQFRCFTSKRGCWRERKASNRHARKADLN